MTEADVRPLLEVKPFEPFTISLTGRLSYDIDRPELVGFSPHGAMYLHNPDGTVRVVISMDHIVSISYPARPFVRGS